jgi:hypothetical protein
MSMHIDSKPFNYPYVKYVIINKFETLNKDILKVSQTIAENSVIKDSRIQLKPDFKPDDIAGLMRKKIERVYGDLLSGYAWVKGSDETNDAMRYLIRQYLFTAYSMKFFNKLPPEEAAFEVLYLERMFLGHGKGIIGLRLALEMDKTKLLEMLKDQLAVDIYLVVKYLKQLEYDSQIIKNKDVCLAVKASIEKVSEDMRKRKLTKEEWEAREKTKMRVKY